MDAELNELYTFLTFNGQAEEAVNEYVSRFADADILAKQTFKKGEPGEIAKILNLTFTIRGQLFMAMDMDEETAPPFGWGMSLFVPCQDEAEFDRLFVAFSKGGNVLMDPVPIMLFRKVAWVTDRFGVTWQFVLE